MPITEEQVLAATRHWLEKAVIGLNLCPFARAVYVKNQVRIVVSQARHLDAFLDDLDRELTLLVNTPAEEIDTTLLVHPQRNHRSIAPSASVPWTRWSRLSRHLSWADR
mgnify:CR=1 FL=1